MNKNSNLTEKNLKELYVRRKLSIIATAKELGASTAGVYSALKRFGIPSRKWSEASKLRHKHTNNLNWKPFVKKYMKGVPLEEIAQEVGCSLAAASEHLRKNGVKMRTRGAETNRPNSRNTIPFDVKKAIKLNKEGATLTEIGDILGYDRPISVQVISRRFKSVGYKPLTHKASKDKFKNYQVQKRKVAEAVDASKCLICPETRGVQLCHIQARRNRGPLVEENVIPLCNTHHRCFDHGELTKPELKKLRPALLVAKRKSYTHHTYAV